jgi:flagellin-like protein
MKIFRSRKALSPVVATIILIAVTVAVSIAVAAWMGALTFSFMATEQIKITQTQFYTSTDLPTGMTPGTNVSITLQNVGTSPVTITWIDLNNLPGSGYLTSSFTISANTQYLANITFPWAYGASYEIEAKSTKGNEFTYAVNAPNS